MINWMFFPQTNEISTHLTEIVKAFKNKSEEIDSEKHLGNENLESNKVLEILEPQLTKIGYEVEKSKKAEDKIKMPVLFGKNGKVELNFEVDAFSEQFKTVIEVEAGRAVCNYQFLKDFYESCMMNNVEYFVVAVKNIYRNSNDFEKVCDFFRALYSSNRMTIPLKGILVIGY